MIRTYKFRIYPKKHQIKSMNTMLNLSCELYNAMLQQRIYAHRSKKKVNYRSQQNEIPDIKKMFPEYRNMHSLAIQDVARRLDKAFDNFFMRVEEKRNGKNIKAGFPRFKSRDRYSSITYTQSGFRILDNGHVWLSKIGEIRMFMHRSITGDIRTLSVKRDRVGDWFITVTAETLKEESTSPDTVSEQHTEPMRPIGTDLGLKSIITTSDDIHIEPPKYLRRMEKKLKNAQRQLSKKKKGSVKWNKARKKVAKINRKIERQRDDFSHKTSNNLVRDHDLIVFEDLNITGMVKNHHLAKSITDAGWNKIIQYTAYRAESAGKMVILVDPKQTSQECSQCGNIKKDLKLSDRIYHCNVCGLTIDRDLNAAINVLRRGMQSLEENEEKETEHVGRGTPEFTPVEIGSIPERANPVVETGSLRL
ncbi:MAG: RNA-guided endonuclease InsQ/TnpB family protein [Thermoplasmataceae archaeon]